MRRGDLFVLSWESLRRVEWGKVSSFLSMSGGGLFNSLLMGLLLRWSNFLIQPYSAKLRCLAASVGAVHYDYIVSVVGFEGQSIRWWVS